MTPTTQERHDSFGPTLEQNRHDERYRGDREWPPPVTAFIDWVVRPERSADVPISRWAVWVGG